MLLLVLTFSPFLLTTNSTKATLLDWIIAFLNVCLFFILQHRLLTASSSSAKRRQKEETGDELCTPKETRPKASCTYMIIVQESTTLGVPTGEKRSMERLWQKEENFCSVAWTWLVKHRPKPKTPSNTISPDQLVLVVKISNCSIFVLSSVSRPGMGHPLRGQCIHQRYITIKPEHQAREMKEIDWNRPFVSHHVLLGGAF